MLDHHHRQHSAPLESEASLIIWFHLVLLVLLLLTDVIHYSFIIRSHLSPTREHTCFAGTATVNTSPHWHSSCRWLEASMKNLAATSGRRHWPDCWCCPDHKPRLFDVKDATTLSWSSAAVSEWVSEWVQSSSALVAYLCTNPRCRRPTLDVVFLVPTLLFPSITTKTNNFVFRLAHSAYMSKRAGNGRRQSTTW